MSSEDKELEGIKEIGFRIRLYRKERKLTQKELAHEVGIPVGFLTALEKGEREVSNVILRKMAKVLGISRDELTFGREFMERRNLAIYEALCAEYEPDEIAEALRVVTVYLEAKNQKR